MAKTGVARRRRIMVVEDNADASESTRMLLEYMGHEVREAPGGEEALQLARQFQPEIILCDLGLPGALDGYGVARALRQNPEFQSVVLIAVTGHGDDEHRRRALAAGFNTHVLKPLEPAVLERLIAELPE